VTMSRTVLAVAALLAVPATAEPLERYAALTSVEPRCKTPANDREILVCGARRADRWRVPFVGYDLGDPRGESVEGERKRLSAAPRVPCGQGAIIANCGGAVGVSVSTRLNGERLALRPLAP
jgi:hypothetical protein